MLGIVLRQVAHELIRGNEMYVPMNIILNFVSLQSLVNDG